MTLDKITLDFFVLGAQKAGTTSLHDMLSRHHEIALPATKETHFFSHADRTARGMQWYLDQFEVHDGTRFQGEIDPEYLYSTTAPDVIRKLTTVAKFVIILRNPLDRAFSQYQMSLRRGYEQLAFAEALLRQEERLNGDKADFARDHWSYSSRSLYASQIRRFTDTFQDAEFLFVRSDSLSGSGYEQVCDFIGVRPALPFGNQALRSNSATNPRSSFLRDLLYAPHGKSTLRALLVSAVPPNIKRQIFLWLDRINQKPAVLDREVAYSDLPHRVLCNFLDDLENTAELTGLNLTDWRDDIERRLAHRA